MPSRTEAQSQIIISRIADAFGLPVERFLPVLTGYRNESHPVRLSNGRTVNIMIFKGGPDAVKTIRDANAVSGYLATIGFPARSTLDGRVLSVSTGIAQKYAMVYNYLPGDTIAWEAYTQKHIKLLGKTMSDMHAALRGFDANGLPDVETVYTAIIQRMQQYFQQRGVQHAMAQKLLLQIDISILLKHEALLQQAKLLDNRQALHMDFVRSNVLFTEIDYGPVLSGILDFEKAARGNPLFDIARTLAFLLVDCKYKPAEKVRKYFLHSGYKKYGQATFPNVQVKIGDKKFTMLELLLDLFLLYDFYKFLRHNPYEFLDKNEHFKRTRDILVQRGLIILAKAVEK